VILLKSRIGLSKKNFPSLSLTSGYWPDRGICRGFKPNAAFYEARGEQGIKELKMTMDYLKQNYADIFTVYDAKRGDIGNTNNGYGGVILIGLVLIL